ncbi:hypothetical protein MY3296_009298 [Beauveria thailandica]
MKLFSTIVAIAMGAAAVSATAEPLEKRCINNGSGCKADGSWGVCCSGFCLQYQGASSGVCQQS